MAEENSCGLRKNDQTRVLEARTVNVPSKCTAILPAAYAARFSWRIFHTFHGVIGMSMCVTPRWARASTTAFTIGAGAPTVADSPTPFAPIGWWGEGVVVFAVSHLGVSTAVGSRESMTDPPRRFPVSSPR